ncbi:MAG: aminopeptidase N [Pseudomonadota bacterium]
MSTPQVIRLADYQQPAFWVETVTLRVELAPASTRVSASLEVVRNPDGPPDPLRLDGCELKLESVAVNGVQLDSGAYTQTDDMLTLADVPERARIDTVVTTNPEANTSLEGLYFASGLFCTQCEAEGFRKITYFPDRPDVMARYTCTIVADRTAAPVLLSNGNQADAGELPDGRHWVRWEDPYPKPAYLFALVAGDLACIEDTFRTASGRDVKLQIFVEHHNADKCDHALASLIKAMQWDEERFGLEYDLDLYMIVATDDFNMGAMENKGLNVFNSKYVLARPDTATDADFDGIEAVIAHEYFHNWTGNRITCRDWFQLSLKEGLTVFRDQEFSADMGSRGVRRIQDVRVLRAAQFAEDAGPMAHPVRPSEYAEINNFYTVTVYNKGAELIRMLQNLVGATAFRRGMDLYFERHDGQAVTTEEFVAAIADASGADLTQFKLWYEQAGTPVVRIEEQYDELTGALRLDVYQHTPDTPGQTDKLPMHMPLRLGLLNENGAPMQFRPEGTGARMLQTTRDGTSDDVVLELRAAHEVIEIPGLSSRPVLSAFRGFSAPVSVKLERSAAELAFVFAHDPDAFNRWDASQTLILEILLSNIERIQSGADQELPAMLVDAFRETLNDVRADPAFVAETLTLPGENYVADQQSTIDVLATHESCDWLRSQLALALRPDLERAYEHNRDVATYTWDAASTGRRALKNAALGLLMAIPDTAPRATALAQYREADNMTDALAALRALAHCECAERPQVLADFEQRWSHDSLVMDKWFAVQATAPLATALDHVRDLMSHAAFDLRKPNKVRALIGAFSQANPVNFHRADGAGYTFLADQIAVIDRLNPQIAARMVTAFARWRRMDAARQDAMCSAMRDIITADQLSTDVREMLGRTLGDL